ncbi:MAG: aminotransferase class V-fold PLP-dependent enzyme [Spirochaetales bacterium]|nr:aminotransferase class V-fold PLP-dependent enzyme [Spirochaetales bacterium]
MNRRIVYLDNNATTQIADEVKEIMRDNEDLYGNASSMHTYGRSSAAGISWAREEVAKLINSDSGEIYFTSGASESNNMVFNIFRDIIDSGSDRNRIIISTVEHPASIETAKYLEGKGYKVSYAPVDNIGRLDLGQLESLLSNDVILVSIMTGNNESGVIQPVKEASELAHKAGAFFHTDATQAIGKIAVDVKDINADYLSLSGHKFYGPKGVGALYVRKGAPVSPFVHGGHQENGMRAGTYNNQAIIGLGKASEIARENLETERKQLWALREKLRTGIEERIPNVVVNGSNDENLSLPGTLNVSFPSAEGESILLYLDLEGIEVSTGSACASGSLEPSYVLLAAGLPVELAHGSVRFSFGRYNTEEDVEYVLEKLPPVIARIRQMSTRKA